MAIVGGNMGLSTLGGSSIVFKRKYRWTFDVTWNKQQIPSAFVKVANRPSLTIEETEINYLHGKMWIPGKGSWETLSVTYYDIGGAGAAGMKGLWDWLASVYNFTDPNSLSQTSRRGNDGNEAGWAAVGLLTMYDGTGETMETWKLKNLWPSAINFGDLDYGNSEEATLELTLRFSEAEYTPSCGIGAPQASKLGCNA
jgi:hypothetical protein